MPGAGASTQEMPSSITPAGTPVIAWKQQVQKLQLLGTKVI